MGAVLGIGCTHTGVFGPIAKASPHVLRRNMSAPGTPEPLRDPKNWPEQMQREWADLDAVATRYHADLVEGFRKARAAIDAFRPDFVLIWGDDQYENFKEDFLPPFAIFAIDEVNVPGRDPSATRPDRPPAPFREPPAPILTAPLTIRGHKQAATHIGHELIKSGFDIGVSLKLPHGDGYGHAHTNTVRFLDVDGRGFDYPVVPISLNDYGFDLRVPDGREEERGGVLGYLDEPNPDLPPAPMPWRCYDLGKQVADIIQRSPWRAVVIGSSSWSHASLTGKNRFVWNDVEGDRKLLADLKAGEQHKWRDLDPDAMRESGLHEFRNWICLAGAMEGRRAEILAYCESYLFNSERVVAMFPN